MHRSSILPIFCLALAVGAFPTTAIASSGGQWLVNGKPLRAGESAELLPTALALRFQEAELKILTANLGIKCESPTIDLEGGKITGPDGILVKKITFHACNVVGSEVCSLENELISTVPIHGLANLDLPGSLNAYILLLPETKTTFATIKFNGATCALSGVQPVTGDASLLIHGALHEVLLHLVLAITLKGALKVGSDEAHLIKVGFDIALNSHLTWSFH